MAKTKQTNEETPTQEPITVLDMKPVPPAEKPVGADQIELDPSKVQEVLLGSAVAEPLPLTFTRIDC